MSSDQSRSRAKQIVSSVIDTGCETVTKELASMTDEGIRAALQAMKHKIEEGTRQFFSNRANKKRSLDELNAEIAKSNEAAEIGKEQEEIAVIWAMRRLGYPIDEIDKVVGEARRAFVPLDENESPRGE
ncbi:hypothetical protein [Thermophilibacter sp.]